MGNQKYKKRRWTQDEIDILCRYYGVIPVHDLAVLLGRTVNSIYSKAYQLGLKSNYPRGRLPKFIKILQSQVFHK